VDWIDLDAQIVETAAQVDVVVAREQ